jgi:hypothetical protein
MLIRLGLVQGADDGKLKPTKMGMAVNRLYLGIQTISELMLLSVVTEDVTGLLGLLNHLISLETEQEAPEQLEQIVGMVATTRMTFDNIAKASGMYLGDLYGLLEKVRWLAYAVSTVANVGNMFKLRDVANTLIQGIETRLQKEISDYDN